MTYAFERLQVWQLSRGLVKNIYQTTSDFPARETYGLSREIRRSSISISSNIAEGISRFTTKEKLRYLEISYGSLMELMCQCILAHDVGLIESDDHEQIQASIIEISNKLNALRRHYLAKRQ